MNRYWFTFRLPRRTNNNNKSSSSTYMSPSSIHHIHADFAAADLAASTTGGGSPTLNSPDLDRTAAEIIARATGVDPSAMPSLPPLPLRIQVVEKDGCWFALDSAQLELCRRLERGGLCQQVRVDVVPSREIPARVRNLMMPPPRPSVAVPQPVQPVAPVVTRDMNSDAVVHGCCSCHTVGCTGAVAAAATSTIPPSSSSLPASSAAAGERTVVRHLPNAPTSEHVADCDSTSKPADDDPTSTTTTTAAATARSGHVTPGGCAHVVGDGLGHVTRGYQRLQQDDNASSGSDKEDKRSGGGGGGGGSRSASSSEDGEFDSDLNLTDDDEPNGEEVDGSEEDWSRDSDNASDSAADGASDDERDCLI